ncbi:hypothetical protein ASG91_02170 [Phycicoccus sp. Soil802]|nr:hypothetical protein ASG91_02170 [Phycicoccus sp. Soil802]
MTDASATGPGGLTPVWRVRINTVVGRILFGTLYRVEVIGGSRVPRTGPVVFVANHAGFLSRPPSVVVMATLKCARQWWAAPRHTCPRPPPNHARKPRE